MSQKLALMLGASNHSRTDRESNDFYATEPRAVEKFLAALERDGLMLSDPIWEPACGQGHISEVLDAAGYEVRSTDLVDRGYGYVLDFLECEEPWCATIMTNPPFKLSADFIRKALSLVGVGQRVIFFQRLNFLESAKRLALFEEFPIRYVYVHASRVGTAMGGDFERYHAKSMAYAWYVWEKGYEGDTVMRWIP